MTDKEIKGRIKNINDTVKITRAMQMIATTKIYACQKRRDNAAAYMEDAKKTAGVAMRFMPATHPLFQSSDVQKHAYVVIAGDKGLCGDYNAQMLSFAEKQFVLGETRPKIYVIGYVVKEYFKGKNCSLIGTYVHSQLEPSVTDAVKLADDLLKGFEKGDFADVSIIYAEVKEHGETTPAVMKLLPMTYAPAAESDRVLGACNGENILREMLIGLCIGVFFGAITTLVTWGWQHNVELGVVVGIAMAVNMTMATIIGTFTPFALKTVNIDPAVASGPVIATTIDVIGLAIYFTMVSAFLLNRIIG